MLGLARFAMKRPLHAGILAALFAAVPMLYALSAALVALTTLRMGATAGTRILLFAIMGALVSWQLTGIPLSLLVLILATVLALVLRATQSWSRTLLVGSLIGMILAFIAQWLFQEQFNSILNLAQQMITDGNTDSAEWKILESARPMVGFLVLSSQLFEALLSLLLARYWQSGLYNPGGFKVEMHGLRFTAIELLVLVFCIVVSLILKKPAAMVLFGIPFVFASLALVHGIVAKLKLGGYWLVATYLGLIVLNQIILPLLVLAVVVDTYVDIRSRIPERT